ncbi:uncharacterized protein LOC131804760 [Musca domestica]|uniref:Uncharacterized protein LOC131804760 n=1 Tax=Musca domestica TaxID=7370 RepID=A0ABM3VDN3_MUSDO|nr:uncharacterized protein LOC131804760 [Musca domestica]
MIMVMVLRIFLFIGFCVTTTCGESYLKITKIVCETHPSFIHNHSCALKPVNRYKTFILMDCWIKTQLRNSSVNLALYVRNSANIYKPFVINATINVCQLFAKSTQGAYGKIIKTIFSRFTNINHSCPFSGHIFVRNAYWDSSLLPALPQNSYKAVFTFYEGYPLKNYGFVEYFAEYIEKRTKSTLG